MATYIIRAGETGPVKIGKADDVDTRLSALQTSHHETLLLMRVVDTAYDTEAAFHSQFAHLRIRGEWFRFHPDMMTFIPPVPGPQGLSAAARMKMAKDAAIEEVSDLLFDIWTYYRGIETRDRFICRLSARVGVTRARAKRLVYGEVGRIDVHETEGLRAWIQELRGERADSGVPTTVDKAR